MSASKNSIRILAVDDHPLFRNGIAALLATQPDMNLVAEASNVLVAVSECATSAGHAAPGREQMMAGRGAR